MEISLRREVGKFKSGKKKTLKGAQADRYILEMQTTRKIIQEQNHSFGHPHKPISKK